MTLRTRGKCLVKRSVKYTRLAVRAAARIAQRDVCPAFASTDVQAGTKARSRAMRVDWSYVARASRARARADDGVQPIGNDLAVAHWDSLAARLPCFTGSRADADGDRRLPARLDSSSAPGDERDGGAHRHVHGD